MSIEALFAVAPPAAMDAAALTSPDKAPATDFAQWLAREVDQVNQQLITTDGQMRELVAGHADSLHEVMIAMEMSRLAFELMLQVRNRMLEAYQDIMRMQV